MKAFKWILILFFIHSVNGNAQIKSAELLKTVEYLSSEELAGRLPGHIGYTKAVNFIVDELNKHNIKPVNPESYLQKLKVEYNEILGPESLAVINNGTRKEYKLGEDYVYRGFTGGAKLSSELIFCGYGLSQPELGYDDYENIDVKNKVVVCFKHNPRWSINGKPFTHGNPREKAIVAAKYGAVGILFVSLPNDPEPQKPIGSVIHGEGEQMTNFPEAHVGLNVAEYIFLNSGSTLKELQTSIDDLQKPASINLKSRIDLEVHTKYNKEAEVDNVLGLIEGSDPELKNEYLIIGAHLDHVGSQAGKIYFPGANDNASGSAALLEIAKAFSSQNVKPKRSIIFAFLASEEQGLYGAQFLADNLPVPKEKVIAMFNLDCIGYGDSIQVGGGKSAPAIWSIAKEIDSEHSKLMVSNTWNGGGADAEPFFQKGIPTLYFVTTNSYKHLHMLSDKPETLNKDLFEKISNLAFMTARKFSNK